MESTFFVDNAIEYMNKNREHPFAMVVSFYDPHAPFRFRASGGAVTGPTSFPPPGSRSRIARTSPGSFAT